MASKASISKSAIPCIDYSAGISLNRRALQGWLKQKNMRMGRLAKLLKIPPQDREEEIREKFSCIFLL